MKEVYVYKNFISKTHLFVFIYIFFIACIVGYYNGFLYFLKALAIMSSFIFVAKMLDNYSTYYDSIIVDNRSQKLIFKSIDDTYEIFSYSEIDKICFSPNDFDDRYRTLHHIEIYEKSGSISYISFCWNEFSLNFLKKLPKSVVVTKLPPSKTKKAYYALIIFLAIVAIVAAIFAIPQFH